MSFVKIRNIALPCYAIAINSYREAIRSKVLGSLLALPILMIGLGSLMGEMSLHNEVRVATNLGIFLTTLFSVVMGIYASVTLLHTEFERRTVYTLLSKPIYPWQFLLGKLLGVTAICGTVVCVLAAVGSGMVLYHGGTIGPTFFWAYSTAFLQATIIASLTIFFATFSGSLLSGLSSFGIFIAGNLMTQIDLAIGHFKETAEILVPMLEGVAVILPNLEALNLAHELTYRTEIPGSYPLTALWYAISYIGITLLITVVIFRRKDIQ